MPQPELLEDIACQQGQGEKKYVFCDGTGGHVHRSSPAGRGSAHNASITL